MKKILIIMVIVLFAGRVFAHDPNSLPVNTNVRWQVNNQSIVTFDIRLPVKYIMVLSKLSNEDILATVKSMVQSWESIFRQNWFERQKTEDMD